MLNKGKNLNHLPRKSVKFCSLNRTGFLLTCHGLVVSICVGPDI
jgi:hypothetical protein